MDFSDTWDNVKTTHYWLTMKAETWRLLGRIEGSSGIKNGKTDLGISTFRTNRRNQ